MRTGFLVLALLITFSSYCQNGKLLLVGGGAEYDNNESTWNAEAYKWAVDNSSTKRVAILHYSDGSTWLENYFTENCGATFAKSFVVNGSNVNNQTLLDSLATYDVYFFRGGDQYQYYLPYRNTDFADLIEQTYFHGGVICGTSAGMAILSEVVYTAEGEIAYTDYSIHDIDDVGHTLANDLFKLFSGYIFDTHFTDRGRMGRLVGFMAKWKKDTGEDVIGIGVDENTAFGIKDSIGYAFGSGAVNLYKRGINPYGSGPLLEVQDMHLTQLLHGSVIDLNDWTVSGMDRVEKPTDEILFPNQLIMLSGTEDLNAVQKEGLRTFATRIGKTKSYLIITGTNQNLANDYKTYLNQQGIGSVSIYSANIGEANNSDFGTAIENAEAIVFLENKWSDLSIFIYEGQNGPKLKAALEKPGMAFLFAGSNARFAGRISVDNYNQANAARYSELVMADGWSIIPEINIIPHTLSSNSSGSLTDIWSATFSSLSYSMMYGEIERGLWLSEDNYVIHRPDEDSSSFTVYGETPVIYQHWLFGQKGMAEQTLRGISSERPFQVGGFTNMNLSFLVEGDNIKLGKLEEVSAHKDISQSNISLYPNPTVNSVKILWDSRIFDVSIYNELGQKLHEFKNVSSGDILKLRTNIIGVLFISCEDINSKKQEVRKIIKQ